MATKRSLSLLLILSLLMATTSLSTDIYLPAMPTMEKMLQGNAELTITGFLIGFSLAQLFWGPISDRIGRKWPLFIGVSLFIVGSIGCAMSQTMHEIVFWRVFQAFGACVGPMLSRAMIRDLFSRSQAAQMLSTLTIIMAIAPIAGPFIGGGLLKISSWHANFWLLAGIGVIMLLSLFRLPETLPPKKRAQGSIWGAFGDYAKLLKNRNFMLYTLCVTFFYVSNYAFITASPFIYLDYFHVPSEYFGFLFGINVLGIVALSALNRKIVQKIALSRVLRATTQIAWLSALILGLVSYFNIGGLFGIVLPMFAIFSMTGVVAACATAAALNEVNDEMAGSAAALLGSLQYGSGVISSLLLSLFQNDSPWTMAWIIVLFVSLSALMARLSREK